MYSDDIIAMWRIFDDDLKNLRQVLQRITTAYLKLSVKKSALFQKQVNYLGHLVTADGISTDEDKIRTVPNFASVAASLHELTKKSKAYQWGESQKKAFQTLNMLLSGLPVLAYPVSDEKFILDSDARGNGIGGVLSQVVNGTDQVVGYYSRRRTRTNTSEVSTIPICGP